MSFPDVIVIGSGVAGLRAAVELTRMGARVLVLESKAVLGGRATAYGDPQTGERVDNGQHVLLGCYRETFDFLRGLGTAEKVKLQPALDVEFIDRAGVRSRLRLSSMPAPLNLIGGLFDWEALGLTDCIAALKMARPIKLARQELAARRAGQRSALVAASPDETVEQWLMLNGQTARLREMLWEPLALAALNQSAKQAAAPPFAAVLADMFGPDSRDSALGLPRCPLDELFAEPSRGYIETSGGEVRIGSPARVHVANGHAHVETRGSAIPTAAIVVAVPWYALPQLFSGDAAPFSDLCRAAAATHASPIASVNLWLDRPVLKTPFLGLPGRDMQWVFDKGQLFESDAAHLTMISSGADGVVSLENDELARLALRELREAIPDSRSARVVRTSVVRERRATFSLAPGQPKRPGTRTNLEMVMLAGDWIDTGLPATIEGASISGRLAAQALA